MRYLHLLVLLVLIPLQAFGYSAITPLGPRTAITSVKIPLGPAEPTSATYADNYLFSATGTVGLSQTSSTGYGALCLLGPKTCNLKGAGVLGAFNTTGATYPDNYLFSAAVAAAGVTGLNWCPLGYLTINTFTGAHKEPKGYYNIGGKYYTSVNRGRSWSTW